MILPDTEELRGVSKKPWWWDELGTTLARSLNRSTVELIYSTGKQHRTSAHVIISRVSPELLSVRRKIFAPVKKPKSPKQEPKFEREDMFTKPEARFAFAASGAVSTDFALRCGADVGVEGKFARFGPYLLLGNPLKDEPYETMSILIKDFMVREIEHFIETGKAIRC